MAPAQAMQAFATSLPGRGVILLMMIFNVTVTTLLQRYTRIVEGPMYFATTAVLLTELEKLVVTLLILLFWENSGSVVKVAASIKEQVTTNGLETLKMAVPSLVYAVQNNLGYVALTNLDAATFQVTMQFRIVTTAVMMYFMMKKNLSGQQWLSILVLTLGVALVNFESVQSKAPDSGSDAAPRRYAVGISAVFFYCLCSGYASVYFEKLLKQSTSKVEVSLWMKNFQVYFFGVISTAALMFLNDWKHISDPEKGFFYGYNSSVHWLVVIKAVGGIIISLVMKYTDNIVKNFANGLAILLATVGSWYFFGTSIGVFFLVGTVFVCGSSFLYNTVLGKKKDAEPKTETRMENQKLNP